jgi:hypothetical protein
MEKMFVYPETVEGIGSGKAVENNENPISRAEVLSHRSKLYRTLLEQQTSSRLFRLMPTLNQEPAHRAHA